MVYSRACASDDEAIVSAWDSQIAALTNTPAAAALIEDREQLLARFAERYARLRALPRGSRRAVVRRLKRRCARHDASKWQLGLAASLAGAALLLALSGDAASAATINVAPKTPPAVNDSDGKCSLVEAVINANDDAATHPDCVAGSGADTIVLPKGALTVASSYTDYFGATAFPPITSEITIVGSKNKIARAKTAPPMRFFAVAPSGSLTLQEVTLSGGAAESGGAIFNYGSLTISDSTVSGNTATKNGGAIYSRRDSAQVVVSGSRITGNHAANGGGIFSYESLAVVDSVLSGNTATGEGGAIANYAGYLRIENSVISKNSATRAAGGIDNVYATAKIFNSTVTGNTAKYAGGIESYSDGAAAAKLYVYDSTIAKNAAGIYAGGIANFNGYVKLADSTVTANKAGETGGGVFSHGSVTLNVSNSTIAKNKAPKGADFYP